MLTSPLTLATAILAVDFIYSFQSHAPNSRKYDIFLPIGTTFPLTMSSTTDNQLQTFEDELESAKIGLMRLCTSDSKASLDDVQRKVRGLEDLAERYGIGQGSSHSGLLSGEWELVYSPDDITRASPFFWAFEKAFPEQSDQIFSITDAIPASLKEVGPAVQIIDMDEKTFISRVKVATLGGIATSQMTTRATILGVEGLEGLRLKVESTKPENSTVLKKLGPLGGFVNSNSPPFPSGEALELVREGSSEVVMKTTFCDESLRISSNADSPRGVFIWKRTSFGDGFEI